MAYLIFSLILGAALYLSGRTIYRMFSGKSSGCACQNAKNCNMSGSCSEIKKQK